MPVLAAGKLHGLREQPFLDVVVYGLYAYAEHLGHIGAGHEAEFLAIRHGIADAVVMPGLGRLGFKVDAVPSQIHGLAAARSCHDLEEVEACR